MTRILGVIAVVAVWSAGAFAAEWPGKPVRVVVPFAAGGPHRNNRDDAEDAGHGTLAIPLSRYFGSGL